MKTHFRVATLFIACLAAARLEASTVTITSTNHDTTVFKGGTGNSAGGQTQFYVGTNGNTGSGDRGLFSFDLSSIPTNAVIQSVRLNLTLSMVAGGGGGGGGGDATARELDLYSLSNSWGEGTKSTGGGQGTTAAAGDATWNDRMLGTASWLTPGGDHAASLSGAQIVDSSVGTTFTWDSTATVLNGGVTTLVNSNPVDNSRMASDVQAWVSNPASNFGWILINTDETDLRTFRAFFSRESTTSQPTLTVNYVPEPAAFATMLLASLGLGLVAGWRCRRRR